MKYFIVLLAVGAVLAQQPFHTSFEDNQQEIETQNFEDDNTRRPAVQAISRFIKVFVDRKLASEPGRFKTYKE